MKSPYVRILSIALLMAVIVYFGVEAYTYLSSPITTTTVFEASTEENVKLNGWIVRTEETFNSDYATLIHAKNEGEKVGVGQTIAIAYEDSSALERVEQIHILELEREQLQFALSSWLDPDAALKLDSTITNDIIALHRNVVDGDYTTAGDGMSALKSSIMKRDYTFTSEHEITSKIDAVEQSLEDLNDALKKTDDIVAERSGTFSAACDGYESVLTPDFLQEITVKKLNTVRPVIAESNANVGKMIYGTTWYYAAVLPAEAAEKLPKNSSITLRFSKGINNEFKMQIDHISPEENGECVVVLKTDKYLSQTTLLRHQTADIVLRTYKGLRIPSKALRVNEDGRTGVYCVIGVTARFKPVNVVWQGEGYALVKPTESATGSYVLRVNDDVIVTADELFDGKVVSAIG